MKTKPLPTSMFLVVEQLKLHVETSKKPSFRRLRYRTYVIKILGQRQNRVTLGCKKNPRFRFRFRLP